MMRTECVTRAVSEKKRTLRWVSALLAVLLIWTGLPGLGMPARAEEPDSGDVDFVIISGDYPERGDMNPLLDEVTIWDKNGKPVTDGKLFVGENYIIELDFSEAGAQSSKQFSWEDDGTMTYQIPKNFQVTPQDNLALTVNIDGQEVEIGTYSIDENGVLTVHLNETGKAKLQNSSNVTLTFNMSATAQKTAGGSDEDVHFGDAGEDFKFQVTDQPQVVVEKDGKYDENETRTGGKLSYTVKTTVEHGELSNTVVTDELTPPETGSFDLTLDSEAITVQVKKAGVDEKVTLTPGVDYTLEEVSSPEAPDKKTFKVKLTEGGKYDPLQEGDELYVTYDYDVEYSRVAGAAQKFWGNAVNEVTVTGTGKVPVTEESPDREKEPEVHIEEHKGSNVEIYATPPGNGIISKDQAYSEADHKIHYTLYTLVPQGEWMPCYIQDDMYVVYEDRKWYVPVDAAQGGLVKNLTVKAADATGTYDWTDSTPDADQLEALKDVIASAQPINSSFNYNDFHDSQRPADYDPNNMNQCVVRYSKNNFDVIFGFQGDEAFGEWGHWKYATDRLIITEYDVDFKDVGLVTLTAMDDSSITRELSPEKVLLAGITNNVNLRYGGYYPGYSVYFNNAERMNKAGTLDKVNNIIEYAVSLNTTDTTVNQYFQDVRANLEKSGPYGWDYKSSMQAVFYDQLPWGWEYVEGSLTLTTKDKYGNVQTFPDINPNYMDKVTLITKSSDPEKGDEINAPLALFYNSKGTGNDNKNHESFNAFNKDMAEVTFTYKVKATKEWLQEHTNITDPAMVHNRAEIRDKNWGETPHWHAENDLPYLPNRLSKTAEQVDNTNLLRFTLDINSAAADLDPKKDYLIVTDESSGIQIQPDSLKVIDEEGTELTGIGDTTIDAELGENQWGFLPTEDTQHYKLKIPDGKCLRITYDALIPEKGESVHVSNKASIDGVDRTLSSYEDSLKVNEIYANGKASTSWLTIEKTEEKNEGNKLAGAKFNFYIVRGETSGLSETKKIKIDGNTYSVYSEDSWNFTTGKDGKYTITGWHLEPGNYYVLEEIEAPEGYRKLDEPILFYYGLWDSSDERTVSVAVPNGYFVVGDPPVQFRLPESGGSGTALYVTLGLVLMVGSAALLIVKKRLHRAR